MALLKRLNAGVAFILELAMLVALGYWGFWYGELIWVKWGLAIGLPVLAIAIWGYSFAPKSSHRLPILPGALLSLGLFLLSAAALYMANQQLAAIGMAIVALVNRALVLLWKQWE